MNEPFKASAVPPNPARVYLQGDIGQSGIRITGAVITIADAEVMVESLKDAIKEAKKLR